MKKLLNKLTAVTSVCVLALCNTAIPVSADDVAVEDITITFDYSGDGVEVTDDYKDLLQPITISSSSAITIPSAFPTREGYFFSGWTYDGIHAYTYGDTFRSPDGNDVTLTPIWGVKNQEVKYTLKYEVEQNGEIIDTSKELPDTELFAGQIVQVSLMSYTYGDFVQLGWEYDGIEFKGQEKFIMPEHDVTLTPDWKKRYKITYTVGDVDRVTGASFMEYSQPETIPTGLQAANRFSRNGFKIVGWLCDDDNQVYATSYPNYVMPSHDVTFTAVWEAKEYTVIFKQDSNSQNNIKVKGFTDTEITTPNGTITQDGKNIIAWKDEDGTIYPVGSQYMIKGAVAGKGITLEAVWEGSDLSGTTTTKPTTTNTTTTAVSITTTTTATVTSSKESTVWGDATNDGVLNIADAVLIMQALANSDEYKLSDVGAYNADVANHGDGITSADALVIQQVVANIITADQLPL